MRQAAIDRVMCLDAVHLLVACQSLIARLRRIHDAAGRGIGDRAQLVAAHVESCEALLNVLSVLEVDGTHTSAVSQCRAGLNRALESAKRLGFSTNEVSAKETSVG